MARSPGNNVVTILLFWLKPTKEVVIFDALVWIDVNFSFNSFIFVSYSFLILSLSVFIFISSSVLFEFSFFNRIFSSFNRSISWFKFSIIIFPSDTWRSNSLILLFKFTSVAWGNVLVASSFGSLEFLYFGINSLNVSEVYYIKKYNIINEINNTFYI